jgi:hypothetical protein
MRNSGHILVSNLVKVFQHRIRPVNRSAFGVQGQAWQLDFAQANGESGFVRQPRAPLAPGQEINNQPDNDAKFARRLYKAIAAPLD